MQILYKLICVYVKYTDALFVCGYYCNSYFQGIKQILFKTLVHVYLFYWVLNNVLYTYWTLDRQMLPNQMFFEYFKFPIRNYWFFFLNFLKFRQRERIFLLFSRIFRWSMTILKACTEKLIIKKNNFRITLINEFNNYYRLNFDSAHFHYTWYTDMRACCLIYVYRLYATYVKFNNAYEKRVHNKCSIAKQLFIHNCCVSEKHRKENALSPNQKR